MKKVVFVYNVDGSLALTLVGKPIGEPDNLGSVTAICETSNGFIALDGSLLVGLSEERADESAAEFVVYSISGF